jgi:anti-sigma regulatory factor (Ser/Thr protein kinase)
MVAVSEAVTNAIEAQQRIGVTSPIEVRCNVLGDVFEVEVRDRGDGLEPSALDVRPPITDPRHLLVERGWGIDLMRQLVDELVFDVTEPGTCVRLRLALAR